MKKLTKIQKDWLGWILFSNTQWLDTHIEISQLGKTRLHEIYRNGEYNQFKSLLNHIVTEFNKDAELVNKWKKLRNYGMTLNEKQLKGIERMRDWFHRIHLHKDFNLQWYHDTAGLYYVETTNIIGYLNNILSNPKWDVKSDREILNGIRDFYMVNKGVEHVQYLKVRL